MSEFIMQSGTGCLAVEQSGGVVKFAISLPETGLLTFELEGEALQLFGEAIRRAIKAGSK